jgi:hypothetical protein
MNVNNIDPLVIWIGVGIIAVLIVGALIARGARNRRTDALRANFATENHHVDREHGRSKAERHHLARSAEVKTFDIRPLEAADRARYRDDWRTIEARFVERPTTAVVEAEELIDGIMRAQGYPIGDFNKHAAHLSVKHPRVVEHYRAGHAAIDSNKDGRSSTEELRQAMLHFRSLIHELLGGEDVATTVPVQRDVVDDDTPLVRPGDVRDERRV